ncbi:MAG: T9SS type A sorting domain-containing protein [Bacteroidia bacterium]|nr:T9SS type A sorting domain-containing protein [Bacteroidia bacterium]
MYKISSLPLFKYLIGIFLSLSLLTSSTQKIYAQTADSKGKDFWLMFNSNYNNNPTLTLFITSAVNTSGVVTVPGIGFSAPYTIAANAVTPVFIPSTVANHISNVVDNKGIHVTAEEEVTVYGLNKIPFTTDAFLGLPADVLGTEYIILNYRAGEIGIVATQNNTVVTITPTITTFTRTAGKSFSITLNQGQTYELENTGTELDFTGTIINSNKPIGVMGAVRCANMQRGAGSCDFICEMLPPTNTFGKKFAAIPLNVKNNGDTWRFLASQNNTIIKINGIAQAPINRGNFLEKVLLTQSMIESDKPILVAQYANGSAYTENRGDPFMMLIPSLEQFLASYTLTTVSGFETNYINIVAPNAVVGLLTLDGDPVSASKYKSIGASGFSSAQIQVSEGWHSLDAKLAFGAFQYGFNSDDSYGFPGGQSFSSIASVSAVTIATPGATAPINTAACFTALVKDQYNKPVSDVRVDFISKSKNNASIGYATTNASGTADFCYNGAIIGTDTITASVGSLNDAATFIRTNPAHSLRFNGQSNIGKIDIGEADLFIHQIKTYPNPAKNYVDVRWNAIFSKTDIILNVYDVSGKLAMTLKPGKTNMKRLDVSGLGNGLYLLKVVSNSQTVESAKIVIQK